MLALTGLVAGHDGADVLHGLDLRVAEGEAVAVLGPNGAGKTTLLAAVAGLHPLRAGRVEVGGEDVTELSAPARSRAGLALVPADHHLFDALTVAEHLALGARVRRPSADRLALVHDLFPRLAERRRQRAGSLSGGERRMLALARALVGRPRVLLLDEPSTGLAPGLVDEVFDALGRLRTSAGTTVVVAEQQVPAALGLADRAVVLDAGVVVARGTAADVADDPALRRAYLGGAT